MHTYSLRADRSVQVKGVLIAEEGTAKTLSSLITDLTGLSNSSMTEACMIGLSVSSLFQASHGSVASIEL